MADRNPDTIKREIDQARNDLASTVDLLAERANPHRLVHDVKMRVVGFLKQPTVIVTLAGVGTVVVFVAIRKIKNR
ncbi:MAG: DUF3618 domain-containing protein [Mycobacteriaceae bacterium]|nr:DUF3618 domain-containing protein [Mycobacteriaceae bacterium]